jgi:exodeoxyribonuclease VII small subunit
MTNKNENTMAKTENSGTQLSGLTDAEKAEIAALPYEQARERLISVVGELETGGLDLDSTMKKWELGEALANRAQDLLGQVRSKLDAAMQQQASASQSAGTQSNLES